MPEQSPEPTTQETAEPMFHAALVVTATAYATHPEGAVVPPAADASTQE